MEINLELLSIQNPWWKGASLEFDPVIETYNRQSLPMCPEILDNIILNSNSVNIWQGARGVGKTTAIKLLIKKLIEKKKIAPQNIFYYSCHNIDTYEQLNELIKIFLAWRQDKKGRKFIFIDEITIIKNWEKGINYLIKAGKFKNVSVFLTGSSLSKRGLPQKAKNKIITSFDFLNFIKLINPALFKNIDKLKTKKQRVSGYKKISKSFDYYLDIYFLTGGFIASLNSYNNKGAVDQKIYSNHLYWLIADLAKVGRDISLSRQIMEQVLFKLGQPIGYKTIARRTKAKTHLTVADYLNILESSFSVKLVYQSDSHGRAFKSKAKKVYFRDPFLFWLFYSYIHGALNYWQFSRERLHREKIFSALVENVVFSHLIKAEILKDWGERVTYWRDNIHKREINFLVKSNRKIVPILIRYDKEIKDEDKKIFKQAGFSRGIIISKGKFETNKKIKIIPLIYFLLFYKDLLK